MAESSSSGGFTLFGLAGFGLAGWSSYALGNSIIWVIIHALCGWFYVLYLCAGCGGGIPVDFTEKPAQDVVEAPER